MRRHSDVTGGLNVPKQEEIPRVSAVDVVELRNRGDLSRNITHLGCQI